MPASAACLDNAVTPTYPLLAIDSSGFTQWIESPAYWAALPRGYVGIFERYQNSLEFFSKDGTRRILCRITPATKLGLFERVLGGTTPIVVHPTLSEGHPYDAEYLRRAFLAALSSEDDILTQFHERVTVSAWIRDAGSIDELFRVHRKIREE